ncbi:hypothetical protein FOL47_004538 [Perkinsus chesapeaki]|uniref:Uncharacterized protein n=1 Tax=Perkinsus chesapeaki TaxID=330153 RepID=A0A7J6M1Q4_PERCH|nr:hypothetical protein FOL47_004538 [Perkinsus chesapeaki]
MAATTAAAAAAAATATTIVSNIACQRQATGGDGTTSQEGLEVASGLEEGCCRRRRPDEDKQEIIIYVEPHKDSQLYKKLKDARDEAREEFGADESYFYGLHSSVTGFFKATPEEVQAILLELHWAFLSTLENNNTDCCCCCVDGVGDHHHLTASSLPILHSTGSTSTVSSLYNTAAEEEEDKDDEQSPSSSLASMVTAASCNYSGLPAKAEGAQLEKSPRKGCDTTAAAAAATAAAAAAVVIDPSLQPIVAGPVVKVENSVVSPDGCVLLSVNYDSVSHGVRAAINGLAEDTIRFKRRAHLTLAKNRLGKEGQAVLDFYKEKLGCPPSEYQSITKWDLVVYQRTFRSKSLETQGPHLFNELARFPLQ